MKIQLNAAARLQHPLVAGKKEVPKQPTATRKPATKTAKKTK